MASRCVIGRGGAHCIRGSRVNSKSSTRCLGVVVVAFRILGPVRLYQHEHPVDLGPAKIRGLLGILLLSPNVPVPIDSIIDRLWDVPGEQGDGGAGTKGREPPPDPGKTLQSYVSKLRAALRRAQAPARVWTEHRRYRAEVDPSLVDYHRFRELAADGQRAFRASDHARAVAILGRALDLWQAPLLEDLHSSWAYRMADSLATQVRLPVYHTFFSSHLELGHAEFVLDQLGPLLMTYETDLTLVELQMRALSDARGQASLVSYLHDMTEKLRNALGVDPTEQLTNVYRGLVREPTVAETVERDAVSFRPPISQLPRDVPHFVGRTGILRELDDRLAMSDVDSVVVLDGPPGVGKTAIATYWARRRRDRFPGGVLYADLNGYGPGQPVAPANVLATFLTALGRPDDSLPAELSGRAALLRRELAGRRLLVVLDNAADSAHVRPLLAATAPCPVLITSRQKLSLLTYNDGAYGITVPTLPVDESIALLDASARRTRDHLDLASLHELVALCDGLPMALRIMGEYVAVRANVPLPELVAHLRRRQLLDAGSHGDRGSRTLRVAFDLSVDRFSPDVARFFALLGLYPAADITTEVAAAIAGLSVADADDAFEVLVGANLACQLGADGYRLHDLLHLYAGDRARRQEPLTAQREVIHRMVDWYLHTGVNAVLLTSPQDPTVPAIDETVGIVPRSFQDADEARRWFLSERHKIVAIGRCAAEYGLHDHVWRLVGTFSELLTCYCDPSEIVDVHRQAVTSAQIDGAREGESGHLNSLGVIAFNRRDYESAARYFGEALAIFRDIDDEAGESISLLNVGNTYLERGLIRRAVECYERSLVIAERIADRTSHASVLHRLGEAYRRSDRPDAAMRHYQESLRIGAETGDARGRGITLAKLGELSLDLDDPRAALGYCEDAVAIGRRIFDRRVTARALHTTAAAHLKLNDFEQAGAAAAEATHLCHLTGDTTGEADALDLSARTRHATGDHALAREEWTLTLELYERVGSQRATDIRDRLRQLDHSMLPTPREEPATGGTPPWPVPSAEDSVRPS